MEGGRQLHDSAYSPTFGTREEYRRLGVFRCVVTDRPTSERRLRAPISCPCAGLDRSFPSSGLATIPAFNGMLWTANMHVGSPEDYETKQ